jgi:hypothetical protein
METIFDHDLLRRRRDRALAAAVPGADFLYRRVAADMAERLSLVERRFEHPVQLHGATSEPADLMQATGRAGRFAFVADGPVPGSGDRTVIPAPPDLANLEDGSADLIVSPLALHLTNDTPGLLAQARRALVADGLFLAAAPGIGTLGELRQALISAESEVASGAHARVHPFADVRDYGALLQRAGFALPVADVEEIVVRYDHMFALMADLRAMGMTSVLSDRSRTPPGRRLFSRAAEIYAERFADPDGRIRATFSIVHLSGWAPHESQQKPLRPGSARMRLADALKVPEEKLPR